MKKKLERDQEEVVIAGVISGLANYFNQDPVLFRVAAITLLIITGIFPGLLLYIVAWIIMPKSNQTKATADYEINE